MTKNLTLIEAVLMDKRRVERENRELRIALKIAADQLQSLGAADEAEEAREVLRSTLREVLIWHEERRR